MSSAITQKEQCLLGFVKVILRIKCSLSKQILLDSWFILPANYQKAATVGYNAEVPGVKWIFCLQIPIVCNQQIVSQWTETLGCWAFHQMSDCQGCCRKHVTCWPSSAGFWLSFRASLDWLGNIHLHLHMC